MNNELIGYYRKIIIFKIKSISLLIPLKFKQKRNSILKLI